MLQIERGVFKLRCLKDTDATYTTTAGRGAGTGMFVEATSSAGGSGVAEYCGAEMTGAKNVGSEYGVDADDSSPDCGAGGVNVSVAAGESVA